MKCTKCRLIYSNPQPIPLDITGHYGVLSEDYWGEEYFVEDPNCFSEQISEIKKLLPVLSKDKKGGATALDIGAGIGKCMTALEKAGFETYGVESSSTFRDIAIDKMKIKSERLKLGMLEEVEYKKDYFDFINFGAVLEHLYDPSESIKKALNWLKPMGIIHIGVSSSDYLIAKIVNFYYKIIGTTYVNV